MATKMADLFQGSDYLAGLWAQSILLDRCWTAPRHQGLTARTGPARWDRDPTRSTSYHAPTWSWASLPVASGVIWDHSLENYGHDDLDFIRVISSHIQRQGESAFGGIGRGAFIELDCKLLSASMVSYMFGTEDLQLLFLVTSEDRNEVDRWVVHHGIVLEQDYSLGKQAFRRVGSVSRVDEATEPLAEARIERIKIS
ncbi:hypothetical protein BU16DRAFT_87482 [Lophium mytilinum]|uniref:Uncharacterized protein n=1 Tax=Lophium mytilinum TaxID=390894 RepID=A0A6A6QKN2_9PEZI|nr:hypothetical protein BU16DRAFT_87482 [Lophium mytilinum]